MMNPVLPRRSQRRTSILDWRPLLLVALTLGVHSAQGRNPGLDLDALPDSQVDALLQAELDDADLAACGLGNPMAPVAVDDMFQVVMCALSDQGDDDSEDDLDLDDLEAEMAEAGQRLDSVVYAALVRADALAGAPAANSLEAAPADLSPAATVAGEPSAADVVRYALRNNFINPGKSAITPLKQGVRAVISSR